MELQANIVKDACKCTVVNEEPVITLAKETRGSWCSLLKQRVSENGPAGLKALSMTYSVIKCHLFC